MESIKLPVILAIQLGFLVVTTVQQGGPLFIIFTILILKVSCFLENLW